MEYRKVSHRIFDKVNENLEALQKLFPQVVKDGELDFEALSEMLGQIKEVGKEKYQLTWAGKQNAKQIANEDILGKTLNFKAVESKDSEKTGNLYIEGDNLEVLKLIRRNYNQSVKMIYIDPPYNTGKDFIYKDNFAMDKSDSDKAEGIRSELGERYQINQKTGNRYHANWLNMMYPRLIFAKDLLSIDGVIFISIDDNELTNLKMVCDEIFGENNFVASLIWQKKTGASDALGIATITENILVYSKDIHYVSTSFTKNKKSYNLDRYKHRDEFWDERGPYYIDNLDRGGLQYTKLLNYPIECPDGTNTYPNGRREFAGDGWIWMWGEKKVEWAKQNGFLEFRKSANKRSGWSICYKNYLHVDNEGKKVERAAPHKNLITNILNANAASDIKNIFQANSFKYSKPVELIELLLSFVNLQKNDIVLDFFSGSATTAQSMIKLNAADGGQRKFIMVQLPEECDQESEAFKAGFKNLCEIGKERIRRAGEKIKEEYQEIPGIESLDTGFKVFQVADTNIRWTHEALTAGQLTIDLAAMDDKDKLDFMPNATDLNVVYEIILRQPDILLSCPIEQLTGMGRRTYLFATRYLVCLESVVTADLVEKLAALEPLPIKFVFRDSAFEDNISLKDETFRRLKFFVEQNSRDTKKAYAVEFL
ncbi:site-specific DNA-methyltransferase [Bacillaceae bacterium IKA-2]|nr:site-specific DNA-methyltransferase [Bacillaceae bacterium IKA-2]